MSRLFARSDFSMARRRRPHPCATDGFHHLLLPLRICLPSSLPRLRKTERPLSSEDEGPCFQKRGTIRQRGKGLARGHLAVTTRAPGGLET
jgi:hypothetical protein